MAPARDCNVVKLAVEMRALESKPVPFLGEFSLQDALAAFIAVRTLCWMRKYESFIIVIVLEILCLVSK